MKSFYISILFILFTLIQKTKSSACVCTTVPCPKEGHNPIIMGNGYATLDYFYILHGSHEVVSHAQGLVQPLSLDHGTETTSCTQKYARMLEDDGSQTCDAGHILANRLGGYGNTPYNIFPQNASINRGTYSQFEGYIYNYIQKINNSAKLTWVFFYNENATMPYMVNYSAYFMDGYVLNSLFPNE